VSRAGSYAACAALALAAVGLALVSTADSGCRFVGSATHDYEGYVSEPGNTAGILAFTLAPALAVAALIVLTRRRRAGGRSSGWALIAAITALLLALASFIVWVAASSFGCGAPLV
jgi:hypothetical protein